MSSTTVDVIPTSPVLGAEITGIDLSRDFGDREYQFVNEALLKHRVIVLRDQNLSDDDLLAFSRRFGTLDKAPPNENGKQFVPRLRGDLCDLQRDRKRRRDRRAGGG